MQPLCMREPGMLFSEFFRSLCCGKHGFDEGAAQACFFQHAHTCDGGPCGRGDLIPEDIWVEAGFKNHLGRAEQGLRCHPDRCLTRETCGNAAIG